MYKLKTNIDLLGELLSYNSANYNKHTSTELYEVVKLGLNEIYLDINDYEIIDKQSALKMFRLMRDYPCNPKEIKRFDYKEVIVSVLCVLHQEIKYKLPLSLSYSEISYLFNSLEKLEKLEKEID